MTGASSGIGAALARELAARGDTVALVARRADRLDEVLADCRATAPDSARWAADLSDPAAAADLASQIWDHYGGLDVVVNNAAVPMRRHVTRLTMAEVERTMRINYFSPVAITLAVLPRMLERGSGTIVNVSSLGGRLGITTEAAYSGSKFALAGWSESHGHRPGRHRRHGEADPARRHRHRDLGPARQRRPALRRAQGAARGDRRRHRRRHRQRPLRALPARHEGRDRDEDDGHRRVHRRHARHERPGGHDGPDSEGTGVRRTAGQGRGAAHTRGRVRAMLAGIPFGLHEIDDARLVRPDWVVTRPILSGICGSDAKLVLGDFNTGDIDNPMAAFSSLPHVPGHEVVAEVVALGPEARGLEVGQRVVLNPWLTCGPRGIDPPCPACQAGDLSLCWSFTKGDLGPGVHVGVITERPGRLGRAAGGPRLHAHPGARRHLRRGRRPGRPLLRLVPRHRAPPAAGRRAGPRLRRRRARADQRRHPAALYPDVEVGVVARFEAQREMAPRFGAAAVFAHEPRLALVEALAEWSGAVLHPPLDGLPVTHPGHIDVVYDSIAKAETLEVGVRVLAERGRLVYTGVATPERWESTPIYFKEITIAGSNAFGIEDFDGTAPARHRPLPRAGRRRPARHHAHAHPPLRASRSGGPPSRRWPARTRAAR